MNSSAKNRPLRLTLKTGSLVFGLSAVLLLIAPSIFLSLLGLPEGAELDWSMRMIGITLVALAGNMFSAAHFGSDYAVRFSARVMQVSAGGLGLLTVLIPVALTWFTVAYAMVGFGFSTAYTWFLLSKNKP